MSITLDSLDARVTTHDERIKAVEETATTHDRQINQWRGAIGVLVFIGAANLLATVLQFVKP